MTMSEESRHRLYSRLEDVLGPAEARTLMEHLPAGAPSDLVTRRDLETFGAQLATQLRAELRAGFAELRGELRAEIRDQTRTLLFSLLTLQVTGAGLVVAVASVI
jgi:hypothetical protein